MTPEGGWDVPIGGLVVPTGGTAVPTAEGTVLCPDLWFRALPLPRTAGLAGSVV